MATTRGMGRSAAGIAPSVNRKNHLLIIGIDKYQHWQPLENAVKDARDFLDVLVRQYEFEPKNIITLFDHEATEANIYNAIRTLKQQLSPQDNLIIYYSGHGHYDTDFDEGYWIPVNATLDSEGQFISNANIVKRVNALDTQHTLMIVDSCFAGSLVVQKRNAVPDERFKSRRILASGRHETVSDGQLGENSPFAAGLLTFLRKNTAPTLDTTTLIKYVKDYVYGKAQQNPVDGRIQNSADEGGEFVFHLRKDEEVLWQEVKAAPSVSAYQNYLLGFPNGRYLHQAKREIELLREDDIWQTAQRNDNELSYEDYIKKYSPGGKYLHEAHQKLEQLKATRADRQKAREAMAQREQQREAMRQQFDQLVQEGESLFAQRNLAAAREKFREALLGHLPGFVPNQQYLEEQINFCQTNISFLRAYEQGQQAMENKNYRLAIEYFQDALKSSHNAKVEDLLKHCRLQLNRSRVSAPAPPSPPIEPQHIVQNTKKQPTAVKKKRPVWPWIVSAFAIFFLLIIGLLESQQPLIDSNAYQNSSYSEAETYATNDEMTTTAGQPANQANTFALLQGNWAVQQIIANGSVVNQITPLRAFNIGSTISFGEDYVLREYFADGNWVAYYYQLNGNNFFIDALGYSWGVITQLDQETLAFTLPYNDGVVWEIKFLLRRTQ